MEIGWCHGHVAQLRHLEDPLIFFFAGIVELAFVVALELGDLDTAGGFPVVLDQAKFLEALATDGRPVVATGAAIADEFIQPSLGIGADGLFIAFQVLVKGSRGE